MLIQAVSTEFNYPQKTFRWSISRKLLHAAYVTIWEL